MFRELQSYMDELDKDFLAASRQDVMGSGALLAPARDVCASRRMWRAPRRDPKPGRRPRGHGRGAQRKSEDRSLAMPFWARISVVAWLARAASMTIRVP